MSQLYNLRFAKTTRRSLRKESPTPETILWYQLRDRRFHGIKFRRQYSIGPYVADFYAAKPRLAIELDGDSHFTNEAQENDAERQNYIESCGIKVLRFTNEEVTKNLPGVLDRILAATTSP